MKDLLLENQTKIQMNSEESHQSQNNFGLGLLVSFIKHKYLAFAGIFVFFVFGFFAASSLQANQAHAAAAFVQAQNGIGTTTAAATYSPVATANNLMIAVCATRAGSATLAVSGWTALTSGTSTNITQRVFYKIAAGGESAISCTGGTTRTSIIIYEVSGIDTSSPLDIEGTAATGTGTAPTTNASTPNNANSFVFAAISHAGSTSGTISYASWLSSFTEPANADIAAGTGTTRLGNAASYLIRTSAASTSTGATVTNVGASDPYVSKLVAFKTKLVTISGRLYSDEGTTGLSCATNQVSISVNGGASSNATCGDSPTGTFTFSNIDPAAADVFTVFLNTNGGNKAVAVTTSAGDGNYGIGFVSKQAHCAQ
jgi:hypothetical protein